MQLLFRNAGAGNQTLEEYCDSFLNRLIFPLTKGGIGTFVLVLYKHCYQSDGKAFFQGKRSSRDEISQFLKVINTDIND